MAMEGGMQVTIVASHKGDKDLENLRSDLQAACEARGWVVKIRRVTLVASAAAGESNRSYHLLEPIDAYELYKDLHKGPTAVLQLIGSHVLLNPNDGPKKTNLTSLAGFVRHKTVFRDLKLGTVISKLLEGIESELLLDACTGERDPRCLPFHTFAPGNEWITLDGADPLKDFEAVHGPPVRRVDSTGRLWEVAKALHGGDSAHIRGQSLRQGFHWDVQGQKSKGLRIFNSREVWKIPGGTYLNVAPNGDIRQGSKGSSASQEYCAKRPDPQVAKAKPRPRKRMKKRS